MDKTLEVDETVQRTEREILCASPGFIHEIAYFCFRDNLIRYSGQLGVGDMDSHNHASSLLRSELSTLIGLMAQSMDDG